MLYILLFCLFSVVFGEKKFISSYENTTNFKTAGGASWYVEAGPDFGSLMDTSMENVYHGVFSDKHWINPDSAPRDIDNESTPSYKPYRAYRTFQFHKAQGIGYFTKVLVSMYIYTDIDLQKKPGVDDWLSLATFNDDTSDNWNRTVLVNLTTDGYIRLVHVPIQGGQTHTYQIGPSNTLNPFLRWTQRHWNRVDMYMDFDAINGEAKVWQNGVLVSTAEVDSVSGYIVQAHFGLYASASLLSGVVYNDKIRFIEVENESEAQDLVDGLW